MKRILRTYLFYLVGLIAVDQLLGASLEITTDSIQTYLFAAAILAVLNTLLKPILNLLFLPIHALTLGLFSIVVNAGVFFLFLKLVSQVTITAWTFPGFTYQGFNLPLLNLPTLGTVIVASMVMSVITNLLAYLVE